MTMPMVKGAAVSERALNAVSEMLEKSKAQLRNNIHKFIDKIQSREAEAIGIAELQTGFTILKLRYNSILDQLDIFADVLSQRAEHEVGVWLAGLDVLAEDGLSNTRNLFQSPALMVYLDRGHGAAIRRARTRLPGGDENPVAVIQIPRERMVGSGIASSLIHEVGHQVAAMLDLVPTLKEKLSRRAREGQGREAWNYFGLCISEIICDTWAVGLLGISATLGLMGVVALPSYFQFRMDPVDPHPAPYIRVQLSCAFGKKIYPHLQWDRLWNLWKKFYPMQHVTPEIMKRLKEIEEEMDEFVRMVLRHRTTEMKGKTVLELFPVQQRMPDRLQEIAEAARANRTVFNSLSPTLLFAVLGQAKFELKMDAITESKVLSQQLRRWAFLRK